MNPNEQLEFHTYLAQCENCSRSFPTSLYMVRIFGLKRGEVIWCPSCTAKLAQRSKNLDEALSE